MTLPPLPEPACRSRVFTDEITQTFYTEAQLLAYLDATVEACAKLAQETVCDTHIPTGINIYGTRAAKAIRSLK